MDISESDHPEAQAPRWLRDADSHYVGARRLSGSESWVEPLYLDAYFTLAHGAIERYLKGILSAKDPKIYNTNALRSKPFGHNLKRLLSEAREHVTIDAKHIDCICGTLRLEWDHARYLVTADESKVMEDAAALTLADLDRAVCELRNTLIRLVSPEVADNSLLRQLYTSKFPFGALSLGRRSPRTTAPSTTPFSSGLLFLAVTPSRPPLPTPEGVAREP